MCNNSVYYVYIYIKCFRKHKDTDALAAAIEDNNKIIPHTISIPNINQHYPTKLQYLNTHKIPAQPGLMDGFIEGDTDGNNDGRLVG